jgi:hypothetical protein
MKAIPFATGGVLQAMPPENRFPTLLVILLAAACYYGYSDLNQNIHQLQNDLKDCQSDRIARLDASIMARDSILAQNNQLLKRIEKKL